MEENLNTPHIDPDIKKGFEEGLVVKGYHEKQREELKELRANALANKVGARNEYYFRHLVIIIEGKGYIKCHYCDTFYPSFYITKDHVVPISAGGSDARNNIVPACKNCNNSKGSFNYTVFITKDKNTVLTENGGIKFV